jgi:phage terminase small subunit
MASYTDSKVRRKKFVKEYQKDLNGTKAAARAGFKSPRTKGSQLLAEPGVRKEIAEDLNQKLAKHDITAERVLKEIAAMAFVDIAGAFDENGHLLPIHQIPEVTRRAIQSISTYKDFTEGVEIGETVKVTWNDKLKANELLMKYFKLLLPETREVNVNVTLESLIAPTIDITPDEEDEDV